MDYKVFYGIIRRFANEKISRALFILEWREAQQAQGIRSAAWKN
jgi:hypothetical protein